MAASVLPPMKESTSIPMTVIKRDGTREVFDKEKLLRGIMKSCNKRNVSVDQMERLVDDIENVI